MSPYQQEVIDTTLTEFDRQQAIADTARRDAAIRAGAFGGGREGVLAAEAARGAAQSRAGLQAQLLAQGFQQAQAAAAQDLAARQGLRYLPNTIRSSWSSTTTSNLRCSSSGSKRSRIRTIH